MITFTENSDPISSEQEEHEDNLKVNVVPTADSGNLDIASGAASVLVNLEPVDDTEEINFDSGDILMMTSTSMSGICVNNNIFNIVKEVHNMARLIITSKQSISLKAKDSLGNALLYKKSEFKLLLEKAKNNAENLDANLSSIIKKDLTSVPSTLDLPKTSRGGRGGRGRGVQERGRGRGSAPSRGTSESRFHGGVTRGGFRGGIMSGSAKARLGIRGQNEVNSAFNHTDRKRGYDMDMNDEYIPPKFERGNNQYAKGQNNRGRRASPDVLFVDQKSADRQRETRYDRYGAVIREGRSSQDYRNNQYSESTTGIDYYRLEINGLPKLPLILSK